MEEKEFNPFSLCGKYILVTGASSGIGKAIAIACARAGANLILTGRNRERLEDTLSRMPRAGHSIIAADLSMEEDRQQLVGKLPALDGVVQCAGVGSRVFCKFIRQEDIEHIFTPNVEAPILLQSAILSQKKLKKGASVVFLASRAAHSPSVGNAIYSASKGAILAYAKCLALELAPRQIRVNCISPAMVWTDLIIQDGMSKEYLQEAELKYPLKRYGQPEDVAHLALYLLSDASSWMTGTDVDLTGGGEGTLT